MSEAMSHGGGWKRAVSRTERAHRIPESGHSAIYIVHPKATAAVLVIVTLALCLVIMIVLDEPVSRAAIAAPRWLRDAALVGTDLGLSGYMLVGSGAIAIGALILRRRESRTSVQRGLTLLVERCCFVFASVLLSGLLVQGLKHLIGRARPKLIDSLGPLHFDMFSLKASLASFPSGHATSVFALAVALGLLVPRLGRVFLLFAVVVAASRVLVGSHYLSDIVGGAVLGSLVSVGVAIALAERGVAFTRLRDVLRVKGPGSISTSLRAVLGAGPTP